ncbi:hypothetical protein FA13DRAFT_1635204 [Coprinellus micaceus]|uniref:Phosphatidate cytidylyltransferase n=1 Tax=Coprinellus micaceus TaxID=71717 RepID=A0A4Y7SYM8_COPMI|nr:hypothetical protein FA13DRAFT_1635204 [Coprinellus micaceus]
MIRQPQQGTATAQSHDSSPVASPRRRPTRSPSLSSSSITFTPATLSVENGKGVQDITRKVIRQLEGLGHLEVQDMDTTPSTPYGESEDGESVASASGHSTRRSSVSGAHSNGHATNGHTNGHAKAQAVEKVDYEIPRKLLHSSIGFLTLYLYISEGDARHVVLALWSALCVIYPTDVLRLRSRRFAKIYEKLLGFLMRAEERHRINGVIWYILGVNFALSCCPLDVATVSVLILSWADTAASTFGRMYGRRTPKLPARLLGLPLAPRKSLAGFIAASVTGAVCAMGFWAFISPMRFGGRDATWSWEGGVRGAGGGGPVGLLLIGVVAGLVSGIAEALDGTRTLISFFVDLGNLDDNLTLPIISGTCLLGFFKLWELGASSFASWLS